MIMSKLRERVNPDMNRALTIDNYGKTARQEDAESLLEEADKRCNIQLDIDMEVTPEQKKKQDMRNFKFCHAMGGRKVEEKGTTLTKRYKKSYSRRIDEK